MSARLRGRAVLASVAPALTGSTGWAQDAALFHRLAGSWSGGGTVRLLNAAPERLRCRADYAPSGSTQLRFDVTCASDSFKLQVVSDVIRDGQRLSGTWRETGTGVSGQVTGRVGSDHIDAAVSGLGVQAQLTMALHGRTQAVKLASQSTLAGMATVTLRRQ